MGEGGAEREALPAIVSLEQFKAQQFRSKFGALRLGQLDAPGPEHEFLVEGVLSVGDKSVLGGESQSGKSFIAIEIGLDIAHGRDFFGLGVAIPCGYHHRLYGGTGAPDRRG